MRIRPILLAGAALALAGTTTQPASAKTKPGGALVLHGASGELIRVRMLSIANVSGGDLDEPEPGKRFVGVRIKMTNVGKVNYSDSPSNGTELVLANNQQVDSTLLTDGSCSADFGSGLKLSRGDSRVGCIPFEIPKHAKPRLFQMTLSSGFANQTGEWKLQ